MGRQMIFTICRPISLSCNIHMLHEMNMVSFFTPHSLSLFFIRSSDTFVRTRLKVSGVICKNDAT